MTVRVTSSAQLQAALRKARPGDVVELADGRYPGHFVGAGDGVTLTGSSRAVLDGQNTGCVLRLENARDWTVRGFTLVHGQKGLIVEHGRDNRLEDLTLEDFGEEAIHLRGDSCHNLVLGNRIDRTGQLHAGYGEAIYVGTASSQWAEGRPDRSDDNRIVANRIGPHVTAEAVDVKEGTTGTWILHNEFDGAGLSGENYADSWVDLKGNGAVVRANHGRHALRDGYQVHSVLPEWGHDNWLEANGDGTVTIQAGTRGNRVFNAGSPPVPS